MANRRCYYYLMDSAQVQLASLYFTFSLIHSGLYIPNPYSRPTLPTYLAISNSQIQTASDDTVYKVNNWGNSTKRNI